MPVNNNRWQGTNTVAMSPRTIKTKQRGIQGGGGAEEARIKSLDISHSFSIYVELVVVDASLAAAH